VPSTPSTVAAGAAGAHDRQIAAGTANAAVNILRPSRTLTIPPGTFQRLLPTAHGYGKHPEFLRAFSHCQIAAIRQRHLSVQFNLIA